MLDTQNELNKTFTAFAVWMEANADDLGIKTNPYVGESWNCTSFTQMWSDTSCGFGGAGGQMMTNTQTVVFQRGNWHVVFVAGRFAYTVDRQRRHENDKNEQGVLDFLDGISKHQIAGAYQVNDKAAYGNIGIQPAEAHA